MEKRAARLRALRRQQPCPRQRFRRDDDRRQHIGRCPRHRFHRDRELRKPPSGDSQGSRIGHRFHDRLGQPRHGIDRVVEHLVGRGIRFQQQLQAERRGLDQAGVRLTEDAHAAPIAIAGPTCLAENLRASGVEVERSEKAVVLDPGGEALAPGRTGTLQQRESSVARTHGHQALGPREGERAGLALTRRRLRRRGEQPQREPPHGKGRRSDGQARQQGFDP